MFYLISAECRKLQKGRLIQKLTQKERSFLCFPFAVADVAAPGASVITAANGMKNCTMFDIRIQPARTADCISKAVSKNVTFSESFAMNPSCS
jgi:hypothetical protein